MSYFNPQRILSWLFSSLMAIVACALLLSTLPSPVQAQSATAVFRNAYENRYTWDEDFPGYAAEVSINDQGRLDQGIVKVKPDLTVEVINIEDDEMRQLIANQLKTEIIHRRRVPFSQRHENDEYSLNMENDPNTVVITEKGDNGESHYRIQDNVITQVQRTLGDYAVTVDTIGTTPTPEGYLVVQFKAVFRDKDTGEILEQDDVRDFHEKIGKYYLLTSRAIRTTTNSDDPIAKPTPDTFIRFNDIQPLNS
ncbi:MAG: DUF3386 family protein [Spirulinaceae cyanobacterium]